MQMYVLHAVHSQPHAHVTPRLKATCADTMTVIVMAVHGTRLLCGRPWTAGR